MQNKQQDFFFSDYPEPIKAICELLYLAFTFSYLVVLGSMAFLLTFVAPVVVAGIVIIFVLRGAGIMH